MYRILTFAFAHREPILMAAEMIVFVQCGKRIERQLGTIVFTSTVLMFTLLHGALLSLFYALLSAGDSSSELLYAVCVADFSGVLLSLAVAHAYKFTTTDSIKVAGGFSVPYPVYPWIVFACLYFVRGMSISSLVLGLILGYAYVHGLLSSVFPSKTFGERLEITKLQRLATENGFVTTASTAAPVLPLTIKSSNVTSPAVTPPPTSPRGLQVPLLALP